MVKQGARPEMVECSLLEWEDFGNYQSARTIYGNWKAYDNGRLYLNQTSSLYVRIMFGCKTYATQGEAKTVANENHRQLHGLISKERVCNCVMKLVVVYAQNGIGEYERLERHYCFNCGGKSECT